MTDSRFTEVTDKLNKMFKKSIEAEKDIMFKNLKLWLKKNPNTEDKGKKSAIQCFLEEN